MIECQDNDSPQAPDQHNLTILSTQCNNLATHPPNLLPNMPGKVNATLPKEPRVKKAVALWRAPPALKAVKVESQVHKLFIVAIYR